ncbi:uncharacterized protein LOC128963190 [Oppia nitens]|uniref:uncharacterized protein LOC128963190 n=1 Tax=Oppia nitens TaxID=1686743 RepID=UPI0023DA06C7|nr:uncharacterized protein LOC128963190 [Oppia nitens]
MIKEIIITTIMTTIKRIIVSLKTIRPHIDDYWFAIPSMVNTIGDLKKVLTGEEYALNAEEVNLFMDNVLLRDNSLIDMIEDKDRIEIRAKASANITTDVNNSAKKKDFSYQPMAKDITVTDSNCIVNVDREEIRDTDISPMIDIKVKKLIIDNNNDEEMIDISDETLSDYSSDNESNDRALKNYFNDRDYNNNNKTVNKQEKPIESMVQINDNTLTPAKYCFHVFNYQ